ncbi:MAG: PssD/Cps14F family polysaccharide biosynthesis glycosyltransferase [Candidatus Coprovivens sp.]
MKRVMFISSAGGHLTELLKISSLFSKYDYVLVTEKNKISSNLKGKYNIEFLMYGSRYYPLRYVFVSFINFFKSIYLFFKYFPDLVYTTGAHTSVLMCYIAKLFKKKIIFVEVFDRIYSPTLSGRMIYPIADVFLIQHKELSSKYPKAKYIGGVY